MPSLVMKIMPMSEIGVATPLRPVLALSRSYSSYGTSSVTSEEPLSISATRLVASGTNLNTTVSNAGLPPQYFGLALSRRKALPS